MSRLSLLRSAELEFALRFAANRTAAADEAEGRSPAAVSGPRARVTLPEPTGPHDIGVGSVRLVDPARPDPWKPDRKRELMVSIWYPARGVERLPLASWISPGLAPALDESLLPLGVPRGRVDWAATRTHGHTGAPVDLSHGAWPVVLFSPGFIGSRVLYTVLAEELASRGYVVVAMDHTYETFAVEFPDGRVEVAEPMPVLTEPLDLLELLVLRRYVQTAVDARVGDTLFVLDLLTGRRSDVERPALVEGIGAGVLDLSKIGMFGHSLGGFTAGEAMHDDERKRIRAGVNLDGPIGDVATSGLDQPFMLMGRQCMNHLTDTMWGEFWSNLRGVKLDLTLVDSGHLSFSDVQVFLPQLVAQGIPLDTLVRGIGTIVPARAIAAQGAYIGAFFDQYLRGLSPNPPLDGPSPDFPEITFVT